jgi:hypothetical protein
MKTANSRNTAVSLFRKLTMGLSVPDQINVLLVGMIDQFFGDGIGSKPFRFFFDGL